MVKDLTREENWPLQDPNEVVAKALKIIDKAKSLSQFEGDFLKEVVRMARRFKSEYRMTPAQLLRFNEMYLDHVLPSEIDAKVRPAAEAKQ